MDIAEVQSAEGQLYRFVAVDRASEFAVTKLEEKATGEQPGSSWNDCSKPFPTASQS